MIGLIGCGFWGPNFARIAGENLKWCSDLDSKRLAKIKETNPHVKTTLNYEELLADKEVKAVIIATPANTHFKLASAALEAGKHVLIEKPLATSSEQAEELAKKAKEKNLVLMVGHTFEYNSAVVKLKECIQKPEFGKIYYLYTTRVNLGQIRGDVNAMWNLAPHDISISNFLLDSEPIAVRAQGRKYIQDDMEDVVFLTLEYPQDILVHIHVSWLDPAKIRRLVVVGSNKMAIFDDLKENKIELLDKGIDREEEDVRFSGKGTFRLRYGDVEYPEIEPSEPLQNEFNHFLECIKTGKTPKTGGKNGISVVKVLQAAQKSLEKNGKRITL